MKTFLTCRSVSGSLTFLGNHKVVLYLQMAVGELGFPHRPDRKSQSVADKSNPAGSKTSDPVHHASISGRQSTLL